MSCEQAALAGAGLEPPPPRAKTCATKAREQVALSCRISLQSSSLQQKNSATPPLTLHALDGGFHKIVDRTKVGLNMRRNQGKITLLYANENTRLCLC